MSDDRYDPAAIAAARDRLFVLSGCSGGGKSSVLAELARRGHRVFPEAGRQIIREQKHIGGDAVPGRDALGFVQLSVSRALHQMIVASGDPRPAFFDRSIVDQVSYLEHLKLAVPPALANAVAACRYHRRVFIVPPWPEI
ncbi:MAG: AAA family ATPase, partial [Alphaproteobacteria bacterium]|nr:AAA family ATPase [Alphaproteobacteria bacterium]